MWKISASTKAGLERSSKTKDGATSMTRIPIAPPSTRRAKCDLHLNRNRALPRIRFHDLRHAHATHLLSSGVHPKVASERLGHSKVGITLDLYSHVLPNMQADAAAIVDDALRAVLNKRRTQGVAKD